MTVLSVNVNKVAVLRNSRGGAEPRVTAAAEDNTIHLALIGCGGRGTGAAANAMKARNGGPIKLVAMADAFTTVRGGGSC